MNSFTAEGQKIIQTLAQQYQFSPEAVICLLQAMLKGNGSMAQFNHPEFGGAGQWMKNGMIMTADMFNHGLKARITGLCEALAQQCINQLAMPQTTSFQSQQQSSHDFSKFDSLPTMSLFASTATDSKPWWGDDLPAPTSTGTQNETRYAYFATVQRLAIHSKGQLHLYDTLDHQISGFSQQQAGHSSLTFTSQHGVVAVDSLPKIEATSSALKNKSAAPQGDAIFALLEKLARLKEQGILTDTEYQTKKAELLARL